ncbi:MAG: SAV_6107 family HEPN domain-containing protein [Corynebacterium sp.]|uniref:SAV_6107 family HEPN domain-containing protein n=1 Tax=Corynebacterium sp. TaxID=1720 RepID=UPI0026DCFD94|nr:SAV_6107 family HEPN domain-containing protein [Corynebacterium sp.]MDO5097906.1 SAV_6107 family HEPN domain-containing protein [Corynebacterium sp.]
MSTVVSATTRFNDRPVKSAEFIHKAHLLLSEAIGYRSQGRLDLALEYAYQAALRTAAARIAQSAVAKRSRKPTNAWDQLRLVDAVSAQWADTLGQYSRLRSRVSSGIDTEVDAAVVDRLIRLAGEFLDAVEFNDGGTPAAA